MTSAREDFPGLDQLILGHLGEDWMHDHDGEYAAAEAWIRLGRDEELAVLVREVDSLLATTSSTAERRAMFSTQYSFTGDNDRFDIWLRAVRVRAAQALAGIHSEPLVDPPTD